MKAKNSPSEAAHTYLPGVSLLALPPNRKLWEISVTKPLGLAWGEWLDGCK